MKNVTLDIEGFKKPDGAVIENITWKLMSGIGDGDTYANLVTQGDTRLSYSFDHDFDTHPLLYGNIKVLFTDGKYVESGWNRIMSSGNVTTSVMCRAPKLNIDHFNPNELDKDVLVVNVEEPDFFRGDSEWVATNWYIKDLAGNIIWSRKGDKEFKETMSFKKAKFSQHKAVCIECEYVFETPVYVPTSMVYFILENGEVGFGINTNVVYTTESANSITLVNTKYVYRNIIWHITNNKHEIVQSGEGEILINGGLLINSDTAWLHVEMQTELNGIKQADFEIHVEGKYTTFPVSLPVQTN